MAAAVKISRVDEAYTRLKRQILDNRLAPGLQATEPEFALMLGMSRTPVREALIRLDSEGLVKLIPRRGARVLPISSQDMRDVYAILIALEPEAAASIVESGATRSDLAELEAATLRMEKALKDHDLDAWADADNAFHQEILRLCGNRRMTRIIHTLLDQTHRARATTLRLREYPEKSTQEHRQILDCMLAGDADGARRLFRQHRRRAAEELIVLLDKIGLPQL